MKSHLLLVGASFALAITACNDAAPSGETAATPEAEAAATFVPCPFAGAANKDWKAWINAMPGPDAPKLIVTGQIEVPEDGYGGAFTDNGLSKSMPPIQMLDLAYAEQAGGKMGWQEVRFEKTPAEADYAGVEITCHGEPLTTIDEVTVAS